MTERPTFTEETWFFIPDLREEVFSRLSPEMVTILSHYYALDGKKRMSYAEIAPLVNYSTDHVGELCRRARRYGYRMALRINRRRNFIDE